MSQKRYSLHTIALSLFVLMASGLCGVAFSQVTNAEAPMDTVRASAAFESDDRSAIDLKQLIPRFDLLLGSAQGNADQEGEVYNLDGQRLSAVFVVILILLFVVFLSIAFYKFGRSYLAVRWASRLIAEQDSSSITRKRAEFVELARQSQSPAAHLWLEFDESLIEITVGDKTSVYNTLDASHFFNVETLASGITRNRMLAAVPGFLTAFGVIGTFIGLQLGLAGLNIGEGYSTEELKYGLANVIDGAKIAFITSVWGVALSVIFNVFEKTLEGIIRGKVGSLGVLVDGVFPRLSAEYQLQQIAEDGRQSRESLQGLAEKIGNKMQESLIAATSEIETALVGSLEKIMKPAIDSLVDNTSESSQRVMDGLLERFLQKFGESGEAQQKALQSASDRLNVELSGLSSAMDGFLQQLNMAQGRAADRERQWIEELSDQLQSVVSQSEEQRRHLADFVQEKFGKLVSVLEETQAATDSRDRERAQAVDRQNANIVASTEKLVERVKASLDDQLATSELIIEQGKSLQRAIADSISTSKQANDSLRETSVELGRSVDRLNQFGSVLSGSIGAFGDSLKAASSEIEKAAGSNQATTEILQPLAKTICDSQASVERTADELKSLVAAANQSLERMRGHQDEFLASLKGNVSELSREMTQLLQDYAEQANNQTAEHLGIWATHTTQYAESMNNAVRALSGVVEDIDDRMNS